MTPPSPPLGLAILENLPVGLWVARAPSGEALFANRAFRTIMGMDLAPGEISTASSTYRLFDRQGRPYPIDQLPFSRALATGGPVMVEDIIVHRADGVRMNVRAFANPLRDDDRRIGHVVVAFIDITAEMRAYDQRATVEEQLAFAIQHAPVILWMIDKEGKVTLSDGAGLKGLGVAPGQLVGQSVFDLYRDHPQVAENARRVLRGETIVTTDDIGAMSMTSHIAPIRGTDGGVIGAIGVATDVTESRRLERQMIQNDRVWAMGTLAASVAHEINNPLTYMLINLKRAESQLEALEEHLDDDEDAGAAVRQIRELLSPVHAGAERVRRITGDLRTFARADDSPDATADVGVVLRRVLELVGKDLSARARLALDVKPARPVRASETRLMQVLLNLLVNAWQALPDPDAERHEIAVSVRDIDDRVLIEVSDTGPGVRPEDRETIFEPFITTKPIGDGTGLGLFVCRNIVRSLEGEITVHERAGGGALFRVTLPSAPAESSLTPPPIAATPHTARGCVLIVDDDALVAAGLAAALEDAGFETKVAHGAGTALEILMADAKIVLVYCDMMMPGSTGMDLYHRIERRAPERLGRVVLMTGGAFTPETRVFVQQHPEITVEKPFDIATDAARRLRE